MTLNVVYRFSGFSRESLCKSITIDMYPRRNPWRTRVIRDWGLPRVTL